MLGMIMSTRPMLTQGMSVRQTMTMEQRMLVRAQQTGLQIELVATLRNEKFVPVAKCPQCFCGLKAHEILAGFGNDINDFTTLCVKCRHRFEPRLICFETAGQVEIPFYCGVQARNFLKGMAHCTPSEIARNYAGAYRSAVVHYGTLQAMFRTLNLDYHHEELEGWQGKVLPFLGRMPDTVVAKCVNVSVRTIRHIRQREQIQPFTKRTALKEAESHSQSA